MIGAKPGGFIHAVEYEEDGELFYGVPTERSIAGAPIKLMELLTSEQVRLPARSQQRHHLRALIAARALICTLSRCKCVASTLP